jgi:hypothetical protein
VIRIRPRTTIAEALVSARALREPITACRAIVDMLRDGLDRAAAGDATVGRAAAYRAILDPIIATAVDLVHRAEFCAAAIGRGRENGKIDAIDSEGLALFAKVVLLEGSLASFEEKALADESSARSG